MTRSAAHRSRGSAAGPLQRNTRPRRPRHRKRSEVDDATRLGQFERLANRALRRFTWVGLNTRAGISHSLERSPHEFETARAVTQVQMQDAGLAGHQAGDVGIGRETQNLVEGRLARAVIADREFADAEQRLSRTRSPRTLPVTVASGTW